MYYATCTVDVRQLSVILQVDQVLFNKAVEATYQDLRLVSFPATKLTNSTLGISNVIVIIVIIGSESARCIVRNRHTPR